MSALQPTLDSIVKRVWTYVRITAAQMEVNVSHWTQDMFVFARPGIVTDIHRSSRLSTTTCVKCSILMVNLAVTDKVNYNGTFCTKIISDHMAYSMCPIGQKFRIGHTLLAIARFIQTFWPYVMVKLHLPHSGTCFGVRTLFFSENSLGHLSDQN